MPRIRVSIAGLMLAVLFVAVGMAALKFASELWANGLFSLALGMLGVAILGVIYRRGERRAYWLGFALFGGGYLAASSAPWVSDGLVPRLVTTTLLDVLYPLINRAPAEGEIVVLADGNVRYSTLLDVTNKAVSLTGPVRISIGSDSTSPGVARTLLRLVGAAGPAGIEPYRRAGHALFALLAAWIGGLVAKGFARSRDGQRGTAESPLSTEPVPAA